MSRPSTVAMQLNYLLPIPKTVAMQLSLMMEILLLLKYPRQYCWLVFVSFFFLNGKRPTSNLIIRRGHSTATTLPEKTAIRLSYPNFAPYILLFPFYPLINKFRFISHFCIKSIKIHKNA
jgi:hypothetical protein